MQLAFDARLQPHRLSSNRLAPADLTFAARVSTLDGSYRPITRRLVVETDKHLAFSLKDIPVCRGSGALETEPRWDRCKSAIVGSGTIYFTIAFPEQAPVFDNGRVTVYNGGLVHGDPRLLLRYDLNIPTPATFVTPLEIKQGDQRPHRSKLVLVFAKVAGDNGFLHTLSLRLKKGVLATCPNGRIRFGVSAAFADGSSIDGKQTLSCSRS